MRAPVAKPAVSLTRSEPIVRSRPEAPVQRRALTAEQGRLADLIDSSPRLVGLAQHQAALFGAPAAQLKAAPAQHLPHAPEEDDTYQLQAKSAAVSQLPPQSAPAPTPAPNRTGLPDHLKSGIEALSGLSMDHVKVHYNSAQPAQLQALAYAQGSHIHLAPGQERHLPHEAWHVVQQAQGRVQPTMQLKSGVPVNDDAGLEREADVMGARAAVQPAGILRSRETHALSSSPRAMTVPRDLACPPPGFRPVSRSSVQRVVVVGDVQYQGTNMSDQRELLTAVERGFSQRGLVFSAGARNTVIGWLSAVTVKPGSFANINQIVASLVEAGLYYVRAHSDVTGPRTLGKRPGFQGDANRLEYGRDHGGTARRHVISSSTLGTAIESSNGTIDVINAFLERHEQQRITERGKFGELAARRAAWHLVHNHVGNLWVGPSPVNTAIGFVRGTLHKAIRAIIRADDHGIKIGKIVSLITPPSGPMDHAAREEWTRNAIVMNSILVHHADRTTGLLDGSSAIRDLVDFSRNADLDTPPHNPAHPEYPQKLRSIYAQLLGTQMTGHDIFAQGGTLDQFMALSAGTKVLKGEDDMDVNSEENVSEADDLKAVAMPEQDTGEDLDEDMELGPAIHAGTSSHRELAVPTVVERMHVRDVSGIGMDCLIRALLVASGCRNCDAYTRSDPDGLVAGLRQRLVHQGFAEPGMMLDLAGAAGAVLISLLIHDRRLDPGRGLVLYRRHQVTGEITPLTILDGGNPICLWLSNQHFQAIR